MAKSEAAKRAHATQRNLADKKFAEYEKQIVKEFIDKFGGSYQTAEQFQNSWFNKFEYTPEREIFLKKRTVLFIRLLPGDDMNYSGKKFFQSLIWQISLYLSKYICNKYTKPNIDKCAKILYNELFVQNTYVQNQIVKYNKDFQREMAKAQQKQHQEVETVAKPSAKHKRKRIRCAKAGSMPSTTVVTVVYTSEQEEKLERQRRKILAKRAQMLMQTVILTK